MNNQEKQRPELTIHDGNVKISAVRNTGENGDFLNWIVERSYQDGEQVKYTNSFSGVGLLKLARLAEKAYDAHKEMQAAEYLKQQDRG